MDEGGKLVVGGEAQGDELGRGELVDVLAICGGDEGGEAEALFEADDAVLNRECAFPADTGHHEEDDGQDNPPDVGVLVGGPVVDGEVDGEDDVEQEQRKNDEVKRRKIAGMILEVLRRWHELSFLVFGSRGQHNTLGGKRPRFAAES